MKSRAWHTLDPTATWGPPGGHDRHTRVPHARHIASTIPHARLVVVPDVGHMLLYETPDLLAELLVDQHHSTTGPRAGSGAEI